jgi:hypothetical protein
MASFGLVAVLVLAACTKPEPHPAGSVVRPLTLPEPQAAPGPGTQPVNVEPANDTTTLSSNPVYENLKSGSADDPLATHMNCKPDADTASSITTFETALAGLRLRYTDDYPAVRSLKENIKRLKERALGQCLAQERASPPSDDDPTAVLGNCKLDETLDSTIRVTKARRDELRKQLPAGADDPNIYPNPVIRNMVIALSETQVKLARLVQRGLTQCVERIQADSPGHI